MNNISHLCQAVLISSILTCVLSNCGVYGQNVQDDRVPALEEIDQLANKNSIPKRLGLRRLQIPVEYDWNEYDRVFALLESMPLSDKIFWKVVHSMDDDRYCISVLSDFDARYLNLSIGEVCTRIVRETIAAGYYPQLQPPSKLIAVHMKNVIFRRVEGADDVTQYKKWFETRMNTPIYKLQVEVCQLAYGQLQQEESVPGTPPDLRKKWLELTKESQARIEKSQTPVVSNLFGRNALFQRIDKDELK